MVARFVQYREVSCHWGGALAATDSSDTKTRDEYFRDWFADAFGYGYGTGERPILTALQQFLELCPDGGSYGYEDLEAALTPVVAWLLINRLCGADILEYGVSPRFAWLTGKGKRLKAYVVGRSVDELYETAACYTEDYNICDSGACNCGPRGYVAGRVCDNPFWKDVV